MFSLLLKITYHNIPNIPNIPNIGEGLSGTDRNWQSDQRKYNLQAAIKQNQEGTQDSYVTPSTNPFDNIWGKDSQMRIGGRVEPGSKPPGGNWWDDAAAGLGKLGASDYGKLFLGGVEAYQGWQANKRAEEQQKFARETFDFQKAAYKEQTGFQRRGINNQIRARQDILKSAFYADPERAKSLKLLEV